MENNYKKFAESFAKKAGKIILQNFKFGMKKAWKYDNSPVTVTDKKINSLLISEVQKKFKDHSVVGEEQSAKTSGSEYSWVCDPVDGTIPFSHGVPLCMFSLALVHKGKSILGVTYDPFSKNLFSAELGYGAYLNGKKIRVSSNQDLSKCTADVEMWKRAKYNLLDIYKFLILEKETRVVKFSSLIYPCCLVAAGEMDFAIFPGVTAHDVAAVKVIVEEAGGVVTDIYGNEQDYDKEINGAIIASRAMHPELRAICKKLVKVNQYNK